MRILVLGASGFLGSSLVSRLIQDCKLGAHAIDELVLCDLRPVDHLRSSIFKVDQVQGDLANLNVLDKIFSQPVDAIFHLAATLTLDAESKFRSGLETNVLAFIDLLERCRGQSKPPLLLFASSISTYGGAVPKVVGDDIFQAPTTSYGTHKVIAEHLLADYSRHGFIDGRALRLPIVVTHPGPANGSISDQVSALIREPIRGNQVVCRMDPNAPMVVVSVDKVIDAFLRLAALPAESIPKARSMNLPGLTVTPLNIVDAVQRRLGDHGGNLVMWRPDLQLQEIISGWPTAFISQRALALGISTNSSADEIVQSFWASERTPT